MAKSTRVAALDIKRGLHHLNQLLSCVELIELDQFAATELEAIVKTAVRIIARRFSGHRHQLENPSSTREFIRMTLAMETNEIFYAVFLDNRHRVIAHEPLFFGTIDGISVYPRVVVQRALSVGAAALIVAHNHPSGIASPSEADIRITLRLRDALALIDVRLLDHVIVGGTETVSLSERGLI